MNEQENEDIALIMRQTGVLNVGVVLKTYRENNNNVLDAICKLMGIMTTDDKPHRIEDEFTEFREVLKEKYDIYFDIMSKGKSSQKN